MTSPSRAECPCCLESKTLASTSYLLWCMTQHVLEDPKVRFNCCQSDFVHLGQPCKAASCFCNREQRQVLCVAMPRFTSSFLPTSMPKEEPSSVSFASLRKRPLISRIRSTCRMLNAGTNESGCQTFPTPVHSGGVYATAEGSVQGASVAQGLTSAKLFWGDFFGQRCSV